MSGDNRTMIDVRAIYREIAGAYASCWVEKQS
jgi:hypothetical protein